MVWLYCLTVMFGNYHFLVCKNFPLTFSQPESNTYYPSTTTATKSIDAFEFMSIPKGSVRYSWLQLALVICYVPYSVMGVWMNGKVSPANFVILVSSVTCVYLNSAINPFLYCWKISSVRQAVKETIKQFLCCLST